MVAKQLSKIGMEVKLEINPSSILREWMVKGKANFFRGSWIADYPDAESYYAVFYGKNTAPPNYTRFRNAEFDRIYEAALAESDISKRYELYHQLDKLIEVASPVIPLYYDEVLRFYHFHVQGLTSNALNLLNLKTVRLQ
jgi:peptide/nickel transport system substrate-binding protein